MTSQQSLYFPPLDVCLTTQHHLISWKSAYRAICNPDAALSNNTLSEFLSDDETRKWLTHNVLSPYLEAGPKTKSDFETKTAPIHLAQSGSGEYDVEQLKADALWLSQQVKTEELVCLRAVILELQSRPAATLLTALAGNEEDNTAEMLSKSTAKLDASTTAAAPDQGSEQSRRERQLEIFLEEKSYLLKTSVHLVNLTTAERISEAPLTKNWILDVAQTVGTEQCKVENPTAYAAFLTTCISTLDTAYNSLSDTSSLPEIYLATPAHDLLYATAFFTDMTSTLRLLLAALSLSSAPPSHEIVSAWFSLMAKANFFQELSPTPAIPDPSIIQSLASVISLAILKVEATIKVIRDSIPDDPRPGSIQYPTLPANTITPYCQNETCLRHVNIILYHAAIQGISLAAPAMFAWSLITANIHGIARFIQEERDARRAIEDESSDGGEGAHLRRRTSREEMTVFEKQFLALQDMELEGEARDDPPAFLERTAVDQMHVLELIPSLCATLRTAFEGSPDVWEGEAATSFFGRSALLDFIRASMARVSYGVEILDAILATLNAQGASWDESSSRLDRKLAERILMDTEVFGPEVLHMAFMRSPYEIAPLMRLMAALTRSPTRDDNGPIDVVNMLDRVSGLTAMMSDRFRDYLLENEEEEGNDIAITADIPLFMPQAARSMQGRENFGGQRMLTMGGEPDMDSPVMMMPAGTRGTVLKETRPLIIRFEHEHSALEYIGVLLSTILPNSGLVSAPKGAYIDRSTGADIIALINALLKSSLEQRHGQEKATHVLTRLSNSLPDEMDIATVIADIMEAELLSYLDQSGQEGSIELLIACADFLHTLVDIAPEKVWSTLNRSSLLGLSGGANGLAAVVAGTEVPTGSFRFLRAVVQIYASLIDDAIAGVVKRKATLNRTTNRFDSPMNSQDATPERTMSAVLAAAQAAMGDAWLSLNEWRFRASEEKSDIATELLLAFDRLLKATYGVGEGKAVGKRITAVLLPAAKTLLDSLVRSDGMAMMSFGTVFATGVEVDRSGLTVAQRVGLMAQVDSAAAFITTLLRTTAILEDGLANAQGLAKQLVQMMPVFAALLATEHGYKRGVSNLLAEIVQAIGKGTASKDPPSLLGQLSANAGKAFLGVIAQLDQPLRDIEIESSIWNFLSAVMSSKQQWFAIYLLTGALPKDRLKEQTKSKTKSLLAHALDRLSGIASLPPERATAMLKFVASAQDAWIWATNEVRSHPSFLKNTLEWLNQLQPPSRAANMQDEILAASEHQMAAYLCNILAANLHAGNEIGDKSVLKQVLPHLAFPRDHACAVDSYNRSLHRNLSANFAAKFGASALTAADFARTTSNSAPYGRAFHYDIELAGSVLQHEIAWQGTSVRGREQQGFADEFARANVNLSLVEAQKELLRAWRVLATTLCDSVSVNGGQESKALETELAKSAQRCLHGNIDANLEVAGMDIVVETRAQLAFVILSKLISVEAMGEEMKGLLKTAWDLVRSSPVDFDIASTPEDLAYYRCLLQVLYLALQPWVYIQPTQQKPAAGANGSASATAEVKVDFLDPSIAGVLVEIVERVVAPGFRALCGSLHTSVEMAQPGDFALLTAILRAVLSVRGVSAVHIQLADAVNSSNLVRGALSLYSWADRLTTTSTSNTHEQEPTYALPALSLLQTLSLLPQTAHQLFHTSALSQLASAPLSNLFRRPGGCTPFVHPTLAFDLWTSHLLPLCLNILLHVGPSAAPSISTFLNSFPAQLARAEIALENRAPSASHPHAGAVTLGLVREAHSLVLLSDILRSVRDSAAGEGLDGNAVEVLDFDARKVREEAGGLIRGKVSLASRVVALGVVEEGWGREALVERIAVELGAMKE